MSIYRNVIRSLIAVGGTVSAIMGTATPSTAQPSADVARGFVPPAIELLVAGDAVVWTRGEQGDFTLYAAHAPDYIASRVPEARCGTLRDLSGIGTTSPDGAWVLYLRDGLLYRLSSDAGGVLADGAATEPLFATAGVITQAVWSPDGSQIAFVMLAPKARSMGVEERRTVPSFVGVFDVESGQRWYLRPSLERDSSPVWSADGRSIFFQRATRRSPVEEMRRGAGIGTSGGAILIGDVESGDVRVLWTPAEEVTLIGPRGGEGVRPSGTTIDAVLVSTGAALARGRPEGVGSSAVTSSVHGRRDPSAPTFRGPCRGSLEKKSPADWSLPVGR